jgi:hypothetical protein
MWSWTSKFRKDRSESNADSDFREAPFGGTLTDAFHSALHAEVESQLADGGDPEDLAEKVAKLDLNQLLDSTTESIYASLRRSLPGHIEYLSRGEAALRKAMWEVWGSADDLYQACAYAGYEIGSEISSSLGAVGPRMLAMLGAHGRAVRVAGEVRLLAMTGFADGASARWRSLHDLAVLCAVLNESDDSISERYLAYEHIEAYKDMLIYQEHAPALGYQPYTDAEVAVAKATYDAVRSQWGPEMSKAQGWAFPLFPGFMKVDFVDLERLAGLSHLRPFYRLGNNFVHAGPRGAALNMHVDPATGHRTINIGGTVFADIAETCHGAMISLHQATASLVVSYFKIAHLGVVDLLVGLKAQSMFVKDGGDAWGAAADGARERGWFTHKPSGESD